MEGRPKQPRNVRPTLIESQSQFDQLIRLFGKLTRLSVGLRLSLSLKQARNSLGFLASNILSDRQNAVKGA